MQQRRDSSDLGVVADDQLPEQGEVVDVWRELGQAVAADAQSVQQRKQEDNGRPHLGALRQLEV